MMLARGGAPQEIQPHIPHMILPRHPLLQAQGDGWVPNRQVYSAIAAVTHFSYDTLRVN